MDKDSVDKFLKELSELTSKYKISINSCGCCNSPWLNDEPTPGKYEIDVGLSYDKTRNLFDGLRWRLDP